MFSQSKIEYKKYRKLLSYWVNIIQDKKIPYIPSIHNLKSPIKSLLSNFIIRKQIAKRVARNIKDSKYFRIAVGTFLFYDNLIRQQNRKMDIITYDKSVIVKFDKRLEDMRYNDNQSYGILYSKYFDSILNLFSDFEEIYRFRRDKGEEIYEKLYQQNNLPSLKKKKKYQEYKNENCYREKERYKEIYS